MPQAKLNSEPPEESNYMNKGKCPKCNCDIEIEITTDHSILSKQDTVDCPNCGTKLLVYIVDNNVYVKVLTWDY